MTVDHVETRVGAYADSVTLMQVSRQVAAADGVVATMIAMATPVNVDLVSGMGFAVPSGSGPNQLLIAVRAGTDAALSAALGLVDDALTSRPPAASGPSAVAPPRTTGAAVRELGSALALISVPGRHAFSEAIDAIESGCDVMIFSDNVPVEQEVALKDFAAGHGRLVMGPDCGTAVIGGLGLGFAHTVAPGPVGIVAASGTGAQQVLCLLDTAGIGVSAVLGVGGRDLSEAVAARSTMAALSAFDADPSTELIVVISKPAADVVAAAIRARAAELGKPVVLALLGPDQPDLTATTEHVLHELGVHPPAWPCWAGRPKPARRSGSLVGLYSGGTLCDEAMIIASARHGRIGSNIALSPDWRVDPHAPWDGRHLMIDFGDDELTEGRPHPMIDPALRTEQLARFAADERVGAVLLDVVLGHGAHPDPAGALAPVIARAAAPVVVALIGAKGDPQDFGAQVATLHDAGAHVFASNAQAARFACDRIEATDR